MLEEKIRDFVATLEKNDVEKALSFFGDDAVWHAPEGEFTGKGEIKRYLTWLGSPERVGVQKYHDTGIGLLVKDDEAVHEFIWEGTHHTHTHKIPGVCIYKFSDDKCVYHRSIWDRLLGAQQGATGFIAKRVINTVVDRAEAGLR